jgi:hypothetical protein
MCRLDSIEPVVEQARSFIAEHRERRGKFLQAPLARAGAAEPAPAVRRLSHGGAGGPAYAATEISALDGFAESSGAGESSRLTK